MTSGLVPAEVQTAPVSFVRDADGLIAIEPDVALDAAARDNLVQAGASELPLQGEAQRARCWPAILRAHFAEDHEPDLRDVLFTVPDDGMALELAAEMLRLGCDRQVYSFRGDGGTVLSAAIRAQDPPYYTAVRALGRHRGIRAYVPTLASRGRVWVEMGWHHPMSEAVHAPEGQWLLIGPDGWNTLDDARWTDIYDLVDLQVGHIASPFTAIDAPRRLEVPLRLTRSAKAESASLWVLRSQDREPIDAMDQFVNTVPNDLLSRLLYAVAETERGPAVVLRARLGRQGPPSIEIVGEHYAPLMQIGNLFRPHDQMVEPPIRRDKVRELLAPGPDEIAWLAPSDGDRFVVERIAESAFRPLTEWVDYLVHRDAQALKGWVESSVFQFEAFESVHGEWAEPPKNGDKRRSRRESRPQPTASVDETRSTSERRPAPVKRDKPVIRMPEPNLVEWKPSEAEKELAAVEKRFLDLDAPADAPERRELWLAMADLNATLDRTRDAGLCWTRALWEMTGPDAAPVAARWAAGELALQDRDNPDVLAGELLALATPDRNQVRAMASLVTFAASGGDVPAVNNNLHQVAVWLDQHDDDLDVRSLWLARHAHAQLVGGDQLSLTRTRDRILARLHQGLSVERDVPTFLRFLGRGAGGDATAVGALAAQLDALITRYETTERRRSVIEAREEWTNAYVSYVFAVGYARLGRADRARQLRANADAALERNDTIHRVLSEAFGARIEQALEGLPAEAALPANIAGALNELGLFERYKVDRLRQASHVLESQENLDPVMAFQMGERDPRGPEFAEMRGMTDPEALSFAVDRILHSATGPTTPPDERHRLLDGAMDFFPLLPASRAVPNLEFVIGTLDDLEPVRRARLLAESLMLAGYFGRGDLARQLVGSLERLITSLPADAAAQAGKDLGKALRALRRVGLRNEATELLNAMVNAVEGDSTDALVARLTASGGLAFLGHIDAAQRTLDHAFSRLDDPDLDAKGRLEVTRALAEALAQTPQEQAIKGLGRLVQQLPLITDSFNTNSHFCLSVIQFMDAIVLGYASEDLTLGELGRRWLDEDEYLVRRRIHRELRSP